MEKGEVIARGKEEEQDLYIFTGSVYEEKGINYIFTQGITPIIRKRGKIRKPLCWL